MMALDDVPEFISDPIPGERLYRIRIGEYIQYNGEGEMPQELTDYMKQNRGEMPPYMPLPTVPVEFNLGDGYGRTRRMVWPGNGKIPDAVLSYTKKNGMLPPYTRDASFDA